MVVNHCKMAGTAVDLQYCRTGTMWNEVEEVTWYNSHQVAEMIAIVRVSVVATLSSVKIQTCIMLTRTHI